MSQDRSPNLNPLNAPSRITNKDVIASQRQSFADALYYINRGQWDKAREIIEARVVVKQAPPVLIAGIKDMRIALVVGHEIGGGAPGERLWNINLARVMAEMARVSGATAKTFTHIITSYSKRMESAARRVEKWKADVAYELHYDAFFPRPSANGYHFQYRGAKKLALAHATQFGASFENSNARMNNGTYKNLRKNGSGFLKLMPCWAILCEPFMYSNPNEKAFFADKFEEVGTSYLTALGQWNLMGGE